MDSNERISEYHLTLAIFGAGIALRTLVGFHSHSGQDNFEGSRVAYGGDFEAQRHWMELTWQLPIGEWYFYDLEYWGLDYPPLTAYVSWICGAFSYWMVGPHSVALETSRGIEDPTHKAFMRATVVVLDLFVYGLALWFAMDRSTPGRKHSSYWTLTIALAQPAIVLIDHGHFQYNTVALGLSIAAFSYMVQRDFGNCIIGSVFFCLALNFKQMTLYYAPAVFCYLLGRCLADWRLFVPRFLSLGATVLSVFAVLWAPVILWGPDETTYLDRLVHVLRRIFPFQRGLFEGKVANLWCALSTRPVSIRSRLDPDLQPLVALGLTILLILPACIQMLRLGMTHKTGNSDASTNRHWTLFLWANMSTALSFFLASFQVHEKSILLALAPCTLLLWQDPVFTDWFSIVCCWTLWPLLTTDRLQVAYFCCMLIFAAIVRLRDLQTHHVPSVFSGFVVQWLPFLSSAGMLILHVSQCLVPPPDGLPDLFEVLWAVAGCGMFCLAWMVTVSKLFPSRSSTPVKMKTQ